MATAFLYENDAEQKQHSRAIQTLVKDSGMPEEEVEKLYETTLRSFREKARIRDYLVILVSRNVKNVLKRVLKSQR